MRRAVIIVASAVVAIVLAIMLGRDNDTGVEYEFVQIVRGDIENVVSATGTLSAVGTVEVGTQVSGIIKEVLVDYNESVREGQVLAVLDTTLLAASVRDARASVLKCQAQFDRAARERERVRDLFDQGLVSEAELDDATTDLATARAALLSAEANLVRARASLDYAVIRSPIDGTVIMRNVEEGQTVAASLSAPTLFVIAEDLADMEIHALVDESDIGQIAVGMPVRFTVEAYLDEEFDGVVRQIWLQPETIQNVVNYTVVIDASNERGLLYPGMTATVDFLVDERRDVLLVPNAALKFRPTPSMLAELRANMGARESERMVPGAGRGSEAGRRPAPGMPSGAIPDMSLARGGVPGGTAGRLWYLDEAGGLAIVRVRTGATDGRVTEIADGPVVREGLKVISAVNEPAAPRGRSRNPLATMPFGRRRR